MELHDNFKAGKLLKFALGIVVASQRYIASLVDKLARSGGGLVHHSCQPSYHETSYCFPLAYIQTSNNYQGSEKRMVLGSL